MVLGLGSGRSGSTSLTALVATIDGSCATHENPPLIFWRPIDDQVDFHLQRLQRLSLARSVVFDAAHWWLHALDAFFARFPAGNVVGLVRETDACVNSFLSIKGRGRGSINHWAPLGNGIWPPKFWDPVYPTYPLPDAARADPDGAKVDLIRRYVVEYNGRLAKWAERMPDRVLLVRTEDLSRSETQRQIFEFVGATGKPFDKVLNAGTHLDGQQTYWM